MRKLVTAAIFLVATEAFAGTISGGGGMLMKHSENPWFLENTPTIKYCISAAPEFGVSSDRLQVLIEEGVAKWKEAFAVTLNEYYSPGELVPFGQIRVATQDWIQNCNQPDVSFQFGELTTEQKTYFQKVNDFVGAAIRTAYNLKELRTRGFVYIAPLVGELRPDTKHIDPEAWTVANNAMLKLVLWHELGHVFGVQHTNARNGIDLMYDRMPEFVITSELVNEVRKAPNLLLSKNQPVNFVRPRSMNHIVGCGDDGIYISPRGRGILGVAATAQCAKLKFVSNSVSLFEANSKGGEWKESGVLEWRHKGVESDMLIKVYMPSEQTVFSKLPQEVADFSLTPLFGATFQKSESYSGKYYPANGGKPIALKLEISIGDRLSSIAVTSDLETIEGIITN